MRRAVCMALLAGLLLACGDGPGGDAAGVGPSPLLAMDGDRLWVLLQAARVNPRCRGYYADPADSRVAGLGPSCAASEESALAWLHANGVPTAQAGHLREAAIWEWYVGKAQEIAACRKAAREVETGTTLARMTAEASCDPYERITSVEKRTLEESGFARPAE